MKIPDGLKFVMRHVPRERHHDEREVESSPSDDFAEFVRQATGEPLSWHHEAIARHLAHGLTLSECFSPAAARVMNRAAKLEHALAAFAGFSQQTCRAQLPFLEWLKRLRLIVVERAKRSPRGAHQCLCDMINEHHCAWTEIYNQ